MINERASCYAFLGLNDKRRSFLVLAQKVNLIAISRESGITTARPFVPGSLANPPTTNDVLELGGKLDCSNCIHRLQCLLQPNNQKYHYEAEKYHFVSSEQVTV